MHYKTKQRDIILKYIKELKNLHFTAEDIMKGINNSENTVGTSTVYRFLDNLVSRGIIRKYIPGGNESTCYQYINPEYSCNEHFHLKCESCNELFHIECDLLSELLTHIKSDHKFKVNNLKTVYYGKCSACEGKVEDSLC